jgi:transposase InsO family protein
LRLDPGIRGFFTKLVKKGLTITKIADLFDTIRQTVHRWIKRAEHVGREWYRDKPREPRKKKITERVELSILSLRNAFNWGTARIQQGLFKLPRFLREATGCVQGVRLSRESINNVLERHGLNGYPHSYERWRFFRAEEPDELWQIDFKGPYRVQGRRYWFLVVADDYSRYLVAARQFDHDPSTEEVTFLLGRLGRRPKSILSDRGPQFRDEWRKWCVENGVEALYAHPSYPQDKGKVERCIQNLNREFIYLLRRFPGWLDGKLDAYRRWFNDSRYHRGIKGYPSDLYKCNVRNLT